MGYHLWMLQVLNNIDKHRHINVEVVFTHGASPEIIARSNSEHGRPIIGGGPIGKIMAGQELAQLDDPDVEVSMDFELTVNFDFAPDTQAQLEELENSPPSWLPVVDVLGGCLSDVELIANQF